MDMNGFVARIYFAMNGKDITAERKLFKHIADTFDRWTLIEALGGCILENKSLIIEPSFVLEIFAFGTENTKGFETKIKRIADRIRRIYKQESVAVSICEVKGYFLYE